jgi:hypothetical protein|tara:strand:+ start:1589 stop:1966 length:378 start_codon:yes stop_codon:yes gene_type:complete
MFDLQYYNKLSRNYYKPIPVVNMLISDEYIMLNNHLDNDHKKQLLQKKIDILTEMFREAKLLIYPCGIDEHLKIKHKFMSLIKFDPNIYLIFLCKDYKMVDVVTASKSSKSVQQSILDKIVKITP